MSRGRATAAAVQGQAALHSYTTAFAWAAGLFFAGALITALLYRARTTSQHDTPVLV